MSQHEYLEIYFLKKNSIFGPNIKIADGIFINEINNLSYQFNNNISKYQSFFSKIVNCISGFLIKKSYENGLIKYKSKLHDDFHFEVQKEIVFKEKDYAILRELGRGSSSDVNLIYYYKNEELLALKRPFDNGIETVRRERQNYLKFCFPFIPKYYGYVCQNDREYIIIEYIFGQTLDKYDLTKLDEKEKHEILFQLCQTIKYFHSKEHVYRDFKLNNIIIDVNKNGILIDFDRLVDINEQKTTDLISEFISPEYFTNFKFSYEGEHESLRYIFHYLFSVKNNFNIKIGKKLIEDLFKSDFFIFAFFILIQMTHKIEINQFII